MRQTYSVLLSKNFSKRTYQKDDSNLATEAKPKIFLKDAKLNDTDISKFYKHVRNFSKNACCYLLNKVLINNDDFF